MIRTSLEACADLCLLSYVEANYEDSRTGTAVLVETFPKLSGDTAIFAVRGTEKSIADIRTDLDMKSVTMSLMGANGIRRVKVHRGFYNAARQVVRCIRGHLAQHQETRKVILTGHSLGGAVALIASALQTDHVRRKSELGNHSAIPVITFGAPRSGNGAFRDWIADNTEHYRFTNAMDSVTVMPPYLMGYRQSGHQTYMVDGDRAFRPAWYERMLLRFLAKKGPISAHSMALYLTRIKELVRNTPEGYIEALRRA